MNASALVCTSIASLALLGAAAIVVAGPLNPPAGPVGSTFKTLTEVEPRVALTQASTPGDANSVFRITQPGSYYLVGSVGVPAAHRGIEIAASGVSVDLNGFEIVGMPGSLDGIGVDGTVQSAVAVSDGGVRSMGGIGIHLPGAGTPGPMIEGIVVGDCGGGGILVGSGAIVRRCGVARNRGDGIGVGASSTVEDCSALQQQAGGDGIETGEASVVSRCATNANAGFGIRAGLASVVSVCTALQNGQTGIAVLSDGLISACTSARNAGHGFSASSRSIIERCTSIENTGSGITAGQFCRIVENLCQNNGASGRSGAGIRTSSIGNVIDSNQCVGNGIGIEVGGSRSLIVRNVCSLNTVNYVIANNNLLGPIVRADTSNGNVSGSAAASTLNTTDPHANLAH